MILASLFCSLLFFFSFFFFFFNDTATTEIYTLSLHDALPICTHRLKWESAGTELLLGPCQSRAFPDRKSTRLNSSHVRISYAVFCLKKKKKKTTKITTKNIKLYYQLTTKQN